MIPSSQRLRLFRVLIFTTLVLTACTTQPAPPVDSTPSVDASPPQVVRAPGTISFMVFGDPAEKAAYESLVSAFEQHAPGIDVDLIHIPSQNDYRTRLGADFAAGTPADVVLINYRRYAGFASRGLLEPLGPYLSESDVIAPADFFP